MKLFYKNTTPEVLAQTEVKKPDTTSVSAPIEFPIIVDDSSSLSLGVSVYHLENLYQLFV